jgi:AcrR family transcriptional regulator
MRRIADAIDYAPASLYAHFPSREALLAELCRDGFAMLRRDLERSAEGAREPRARLVALGQAYVRFALEHPDTYRLIFMEDPVLTKSIFESTEFDDGAQAFALITRPLAELRAGGALATDPLEMADLFWVLIHGIASLRLSCPALPATDDATLIALAVTTMLEGQGAR